MGYKPKQTGIIDELYGRLLRLYLDEKQEFGFNVQASRGSPEGRILGRSGDLAMDIDTATLYLKTGPAPTAKWTTTGWVVIASSGGVPLAEHGSVGFGVSVGAAVVQAGSGGAYANVSGASTLDPAVAFESPANNQLQYTGSGGSFFVGAIISCQSQEVEETVPALFRLTHNGAPVSSSEVFATVEVTGSVIMSTAAQLELTTGDTIAAQIQNSGFLSAMTATMFRMQAHRV